MIYVYTFTSIAIISIISFIGILGLLVSFKNLKKITLLLVSLSTGTLLGGAFLHIMPEVIEENGANNSIWLALITGIIIFFILEKIICWRHCHIPTSEEHPHPIGKMNLLGDFFHNFIDGMLVAGSFLVDTNLGIATSIAVIMHEIPQEIADFGILIHAGYSKAKALFLNFLISLSAFLGAILVLLAGVKLDNISTFILPFTAGGFIYIATADLIPELKKAPGLKKSASQLLGILLGISIMMALKFFGE